MRRGGYLLLEVLIAVGLLVLGLSVVGMQFRESFFASIRTEEQVRAMFLAEETLASLDAGIIELDKLDDVYEEEYGALFPDFGWRLTMEETVTEGLELVTVEVLEYAREDVRERFDFDVAEVVYTVRTLRAIPTTLDFELDFGLDESRIEALTEQVGSDVLDPYNFDPSFLRTLPPDQLLEVIPILMEALGLSSGDLGRLLPPGALDGLEGSQDGSDGEDQGETGGDTSGEGSDSSGNAGTGSGDSGTGDGVPTLEDLERGLPR